MAPRAWRNCIRPGSSRNIPKLRILHIALSRSSFLRRPKVCKVGTSSHHKTAHEDNNNVNEVQRRLQTNQIPSVAGLIPTLRFCEIANEAEKKSQAEFQLLEVFRFYVFICGVGRLVKLVACSASL